MENNNLSEYLTLRQVSELLKVHPNTLRNWDENGTLKAARFGEKKLRRYKKEDIQAFIEKSTQESEEK